MKNETLYSLKRTAAEIRQLAVSGICAAGCGHPGGSLSIADILSYLYFYEMKIDPQQPGRPNRDRLVLSKGHAAPAYYAALALKGYFSPDEMQRLRQLDSFLQGHPDMVKVPGVDMSTGSLGQGLSAANGMALAGRRANLHYRVYCIIGDGESQEGQIWEAVMTASHYKLANVTVFLDQNGLQIDGAVTEVMDNTPYGPKFEAFGWNVLSVDGNDIEQLHHAVRLAHTCTDRPTVIICHTIKGKGVSYMEGQCAWHGAAPNETQRQQAMDELHRAYTEWEAEE